MTGIRISPPFRFVAAASPAYLKQHGVPQHPRDLLEHACLHYRFESGDVYKRWEFEEAGKEISVATPCALIVNDAYVMRECAIKGLGLIYTPDNLIADAVKLGELEICLESFASHSEGYFLYYPNLYQVSPKLRALINYLKATRAGGRSS